MPETHIDIGLRVIADRMQHLRSSWRWADLDEIESQLQIVLVERIIPRFDATRGVSFEGWCRWKVQREAIDALRVITGHRRVLPRPISLSDSSLMHSDDGAIGDIDQYLGRLGFSSREPDPADAVVARQHLADVEAGLRRLRPRLREVMRMKLAGMRQRDIARAMGLDETRISQLVAEARRCVADNS